MSRTRTRLLALTCALAAATAGATTVPADASTAHSARSVQARSTSLPGLSRLLATGTSTHRAIVTFDKAPSAGQIKALRGLGLKAQPMKALPLALVAGPTAKLAKAAGIGTDVYPDETLQYADTASTDAMSSSPSAARALRAKGFTGKGVTVGIVDSGCDATHPDLADRVKHNVTLLSPEYANLGTTPYLALPVDQGPYSNTDLGSGHGTHVAGIIAADGSSGAGYLGVAPGAELACFAIGAVITTTAVVTAYDYALAQPGMLGIDVFNNSWGNSFRQYDPADPVNVATRAATARGATVVFAAGNSGSEDGEASVSPFNQAPWVISVAAGDVQRVRGDFSSNGLEYDNGRAAPIGAGGHTVFTGDRVGNTQPDVMAPGVDISSSCDSTGSVIGPCPDHGQATASGTSMASPHVAGAAAVLKGANPRLTPAQIQSALKATATPVKAAKEDGARAQRLLSWQVGYGHVNLDKAVKLVRAKGFAKKVRKAQRTADKRLARQDAYRVARSDLWQEAAPAAAAFGSYDASHRVAVGRGVSALKVAVVYPTTGQAGVNLFDFSAVVRDATGEVVGTTTSDVFYSSGISHVLVKGVGAGTYTIEVVGNLTVSDPDTVDSDSVNGRVVFVQAAQLVKR